MTNKTNESLRAYNEITGLIDSMLRNEIQRIEDSVTDAESKNWDWWEHHKRMAASDLELVRIKIQSLTNEVFLDTLREIEFANTAPRPRIELVERIELPRLSKKVEAEVVTD